VKLAPTVPFLANFRFADHPGMIDNGYVDLLGGTWKGIIRKSACHGFVSRSQSLPTDLRRRTQQIAWWGLDTDRKDRFALIKHKEHTNMKPKNTICLWFDKDAHEAARFYAATFPDSKVTAVHEAPGDYPGGKKGDVLTVEFTVLGIPCLGLNGGPTFRHTEAFSFQVATDSQEETDRYWNAIVGNDGKESQCGWCKDRWGLSWQITPRALTDALAAGGGEAKRAFEAMMPMKKIDIATIEAARRG
jgi:predicted 3-demethylubiquinone-9 3-methyltransferase (glyoxalase superfamily)